MSDPRTFWLTVMNVVLGLAVVLLVAGVVTGILCEMVAKWRKRRAVWDELDRDMWRAFHDAAAPGGRRRR